MLKRSLQVRLIFLIVLISFENSYSQEYQSSSQASSDFVPENHIIMVDEDGIPLKPVGINGKFKFKRFQDSTGEVDTTKFKDYVNNLLDNLKKPSHRDKHILFFAHGGMQRLKSSIGNAEQIYKNMQKDSTTAENYYPIFLIWQSNIFVSLQERIFTIRRGMKRTDTFVGKFELATTSLPFLSILLARGIAESPATLLTQAGADFYQLVKRPVLFGKNIFVGKPQSSKTDILYDKLHSEYKDNKHALTISQGESESGSIENGLRLISNFLHYPTKAVTAPIISSLGKEAWINMRRHSSTPFYIPKGVKVDKKNRTYSTTNHKGPYSKFFDEFIKRIGVKNKRTKITFIGHSMGTIIFENVLRYYSKKIVFDNIVFMAGASSIASFEDTVIPYLESSNGKNTKFFNLSLHRFQEFRLMEIEDRINRGSLLVWIDNMFVNQETTKNRTIGKWGNFIFHAPLYPENIKRKIHLKSFNSGLGQPGPQDHGGGFTKTAFWKPAFWAYGNQADSSLYPYFGKIDSSKVTVDTHINFTKLNGQWMQLYGGNLVFNKSIGLTYFDSRGGAFNSVSQTNLNVQYMGIHLDRPKKVPMNVFVGMGSAHQHNENIFKTKQKSRFWILEPTVFDIDLPFIPIGKFKPRIDLGISYRFVFGNLRDIGLRATNLWGVNYTTGLRIKF